VNPALVAIVLAIGAGAVIAVSTREAGAAAIGLAVALVGAALLSDPLPSASILAVRIVAALLAAALVRWAAPGSQRQYSPLGWPAEALLAAAAAVSGIGLALGLASVAPVGDERLMTTMALTVGAGASLLVLGAAPLVHAEAGIRRAIGLVLVTQAVLVLRSGIAAGATELEEVARAGLLVAAAAGGATLARAAALAYAGGHIEPDVDEIEPRPPGRQAPRGTAANR
jgi:hypothetical protein